jgi:hypothetical protein
MRFNYNGARLPKNKILINRINDASLTVYTKLLDYDVSKHNDISDYNKRYFGNLTNDESSIIEALQKYSYLLV